jgi:hypothetical protein
MWKERKKLATTMTMVVVAVVARRGDFAVFADEQLGGGATVGFEELWLWFDFITQCNLNHGRGYDSASQSVFLQNATISRAVVSITTFRARDHFASLDYSVVRQRTMAVRQTPVFFTDFTFSYCSQLFTEAITRDTLHEKANHGTTVCVLKFHEPTNL